MARDLPPLSAVRVFETAARHASFTKAAAELGMTQAAVSYQIKVLEERVGAPLFLRGKRQVELSDIGRRMLPATTEAFDLLSSAFTAARGGAAGVLSLNVIPTFAAMWLARHLGQFQMGHPDLAVRLAVAQEIIDFGRGDVDVTIRSGDGNWPGLEAHKLVDAAFTPMLSPALLERLGGLSHPADLLSAPLIDPGDLWWDIWFARAGVPRASAAGHGGSKMGAQHLESVAAMAGHGVAILTPFFYRDEIAAGRLVQPFDLVCEGESAYWLCYPSSRRTLPKIRIFREWLLGHFASPDDAQPPFLGEGL